MSAKTPLPPPGNERLAELVRRHRAEQAERRAKYGDPEEASDRFAERVLGSERAQEELREWLRENAPWTLDDAEEDVNATNGRQGC